MERVKVFELNDFDKKLKFQIKLFDVTKGLAFFDKVVNLLKDIKGQNVSIAPFLRDLLPLATMYDGTGTTPLQTLSIDDVDVLFENPLSVIELGMAILEHQMVFMQNSTLFQKYLDTVKSMFQVKTSG